MNVQAVDTNTKPTVISTFCGTGGSSLGYKWAGFKELLAVDYDKHAAECFRKNFPEVPVWHKSVAEITGEEILQFCKIKKGELDIFDGSPPCQGFSMALAKRNVADPRNDLFKHYVRLVQELEPKVFVMENVPGMIRGKMKGKFIEIMNALKDLPYQVKCKKMNSKYYSVPQARERLIFMGVRDDLKKQPVYPDPNSKIISVSKALKDVPKGNMTGSLTYKFLKENVHKIKPGESASKYHPKGSFFNNIRAPLFSPCCTITKRPTIIHPLEDRLLSINECKALCSFPLNWDLGNNFEKAWNRLGNAVMPKFMQAIAEKIKADIL